MGTSMINEANQKRKPNKAKAIVLNTAEWKTLLILLAMTRHIYKSEEANALSDEIQRQLAA